MIRVSLAVASAENWQLAVSFFVIVAPLATRKLRPVLNEEVNRKPIGNIARMYIKIINEHCLSNKRNMSPALDRVSFSWYFEFFRSRQVSINSSVVHLLHHLSPQRRFSWPIDQPGTREFAFNCRQGSRMEDILKW